MVSLSVSMTRHITREDIILKYLQKTAALLMALLLLAAMIPTVFAADNDNGVSFKEVEETVYTITAVNVRTGPGTSFKRITTLPYGYAIERIGIGKNGWSKVIYEGETAYMYSDYLSTGMPVTGAPGIDYSELSHQIVIANGLRKSEYATDSWKKVSDALNHAVKALSSDSQKTVDKRKDALEAAIADLVKVDRTALEDALNAAEDFATSDENNAIWFQLMDAVNDGKKLLGSNDQEEIDEKTEQIQALLAQVKLVVEEMKTPKIVTQEVKVEVPPVDDYCNIPGHRVWPVLFFCSLAVNVALGAVIVVYVYRKKKNQKDDTPLVDYDISDDMF